MSEWMAQFHFIEPLWLLALAPLGLMLWVAWRADAARSAWRRVVDPRLLAVLWLDGEERARRWPLRLLAAGWTLAVLALANPTVERKPVPAFRPDAARVVVLDLSRSMLAADLTPSRYERARYKVADILTRSADARVGLVAFAGEAFVIAPLTGDVETVRHMLDALSPQVMPVQGSRPERGIERGLALLQQAGAHHGELILLTDDAGGLAAREAAQALHDAGHRLGVIGVGTREGAPVPGVTRSNAPVIARLQVDSLKRLAHSGGGAYATLTSTLADLDQVLGEPERRALTVAEQAPMLTERWHALGPWLVLVLLPLAALAFRRGWLLGLVLVAGPGVLMTPAPALAFGWADLWQRPEQQAAAALAAGDPERARELAHTPAQAGSAAYRLGDYAAAAAHFAAGDRAIDHYNRGTALARSGNLQAALEAFDAALARDPALADAAYNREQVAQALQQLQRAQRSPSAAQSGQDHSQQANSQSEPAAAGTATPPRAAEADAQRAPRTGDAAGAKQSQGSQAAAKSEPSQPAAAGQMDGEARHGASAAERPGALGTAGPEEAERAAADDRDAAAAAAVGSGADQDARLAGEASLDERPDQGADARARRPLARSTEAREAQQAAEQWLRRIPDDPAELLRQKLRYQYRARRDDPEALVGGEPW